MTQSILVLNAGSSSLKFAVYDATGTTLGPMRFRGRFTGIGGQPRFEARDHAGQPLPGPACPAAAGDGHACALDALLGWLNTGSPATGRLIAAGHRIVHGGDEYSTAVPIDADVLAALDALVPLARLHQPFGLAAVRALQARDGELFQAACFDTAFHCTLPDVARRYALPRDLTASGVRRFGFHGISYAYLADELARRCGDLRPSRVVAAHLGSGASLCAMRDGCSIATTMGFTPLEGLVMGTRSGSVDPGILLYLLQERGLSADDLSRMLNQESGLLGMSGFTADMKVLLESDVGSAREAVDSYVYAIVREIGALAACLGGLDAIVFTAGVGERSAPVRRRVCETLSWLGLKLDPRANEAHAFRIDAHDSRLRVYVIPTDEELMIARATLRLAHERR